MYLSKEDKFKILEDNKASKDVYNYLEERFKTLTIEVCGDYKGQVFDLMKIRALEGWCWQTTESSIIFLNDEDYIERGNLILEQYTKMFKTYYHSWINFHYKDIEYTFDPCLNFLCNKTLYQEVFETEVRGRVNAKEVRDELINALLNSKYKMKNKHTSKLVEDFFEEILGSRDTETFICGDKDVTSAFYQNNTGYKADLEEGKIKKLVAHFYDKSC